MWWHSSSRKPNNYKTIQVHAICCLWKHKQTIYTVKGECLLRVTVKKYCNSHDKPLLLCELQLVMMRCHHYALVVAFCFEAEAAHTLQDTRIIKSLV